MTDVAAGTAALAGQDCAAREEALAHFYEKHAKGNDLILCKWFTMQATANVPGALGKVDKLLAHPDFSLTNPNKCRSWSARSPPTCRTSMPRTARATSGSLTAFS